MPIIPGLSWCSCRNTWWRWTEGGCDNLGWRWSHLFMRMISTSRPERIVRYFKSPNKITSLRPVMSGYIYQYSTLDYKFPTIRIHIRLPLPIQEALRFMHTDAAISRLRPIIILFFCRLFRKVYAASNWMYFLLPIDRFLRMRSREILMYLYTIVSLRFSSLEPVCIHYFLFRSCRTHLVSRTHLTFSQYLRKWENDVTYIFEADIRSRSEEFSSLIWSSTTVIVRHY